MWQIPSVGMVWDICRPWCLLRLKVVVLAACRAGRYRLWRWMGGLHGARDLQLNSCVQFPATHPPTKNSSR